MGLSRAEAASAYETYGHLVLRRCRAVLRDASLSDDALQEVYVRLMRYGDGFRDVSAPLRWLYRVADRVCFDLIDKRKRQLGRVGTEKLEQMLVHEADGARVAGGNRCAERDLAMRLLDRLDSTTKRIVVLHYIDGLSQAEVAQETGLSRQSVNKKLGRLKRRADSMRRALGVTV